MRKLILTLCFMIVSSTAIAQAVCGPYQTIINNIKKTHNEVPIARGIGAQGNVYELLTSNNTWTIIGINNKKFTCVLAFGKTWTPIKPEKLGVDL